MEWKASVTLNNPEKIIAFKYLNLNFILRCKMEIKKYASEKSVVEKLYVKCYINNEFLPLI